MGKLYSTRKAAEDVAKRKRKAGFQARVKKRTIAGSTSAVYEVVFS